MFRVTDLTNIDRLRQNITSNNERLAQVSVELSTGQRINTPSDDPTGTAAALQYSAAIATEAELTKSADAAKSRLSAADAALGSLTDVLQSARQLTVQAGSGTL